MSREKCHGWRILKIEKNISIFPILNHPLIHPLFSTPISIIVYLQQYTTSEILLRALFTREVAKLRDASLQLTEKTSEAIFTACAIFWLVNRNRSKLLGFAERWYLIPWLQFKMRGGEKLTNRNHSKNFMATPFQPRGTQETRTLPTRQTSHMMYRPHAAVYSSCTEASPIHNSITLRPMETEKNNTPLSLKI